MSSVVPSVLFQPSTGSVQHRRTPVVPPDQLISQPAVIGATLLLDVVAVCLCGLATSRGAQLELAPLALQILGVCSGFLALLSLRYAYTIRALSSAPRACFDVAVSLALGLAGLIVVDALLGDFSPATRHWLIVWWLAAVLLCVAARLLLAGRLAAWTQQGRLARRAVIVGGGEEASELLNRLDRTSSGALQILGLFDDRDEERSPQVVGAYTKLGRFADLVEFCRAQRVDLLIVALPQTAEDRILHILKKLWELPIDVRIAALNSRLKLRSRAYTYIGDAPFLPVFDKPMSDWNVALKNILDRTLAALALLFLSPLMALIAIAVKLDSPGPALFKQIRHGFNNEPIEVYKFRSMYVNKSDAHGAVQVTRTDPRVTRVGRFIRKTSLDELPQLFNVVFRGNLALVGPRPHALQSKAGNRLYDEVVDGYFARHRVKPGITGWAQVNGWRGETDTVEKLEQRVAHDLHYIENWSILLDLRILFMTPISLISGKNAY